MKPYNSRPTHLLPNEDLETKSQSVGKRKIDRSCSSQLDKKESLQDAFFTWKILTMRLIKQL